MYVCMYSCFLSNMLTFFVQMTKSMKALEKDNASLKSRWEKGTQGLAEMTDERDSQTKVHVLSCACTSVYVCV